MFISRHFIQTKVWKDNEEERRHVRCEMLLSKIKTDTVLWPLARFSTDPSWKPLSSCTICKEVDAIAFDGERDRGPEAVFLLVSRVAGIWTWALKSQICDFCSFPTHIIVAVSDNVTRSFSQKSSSNLFFPLIPPSLLPSFPRRKWRDSFSIINTVIPAPIPKTHI